MRLSTASLEAGVARVRTAAQLDVCGLNRAELLGLQAGLAQVRRDVDALLASVAGEVARRSAPGDGAAGLARREGFATPAQLVASATGGSAAEAQRMIDVGTSLAALDAPSEHRDNAEPALFACVAAATREGKLSIDAAAAITATLRRLRAAQADATGLDSLRALEKRLVDKAVNLPLASVRKLAWRCEAAHDPRAWARREERIHEERAVSTRDDDSGAVVITARLDPMSAAPVRAWLDAQVRDALQKRRDQDPASADARAPHQIRADAFVSLFQHGLDCDAPTSGVKTTVVVRMHVRDLVSGDGIGEIDGASQPVSAGLLRRAAADAALIPMVLSSQDEVINVGRARRLFSPAQRLALVERDGGCSWCNAPPSYCEAHHIRWWDRDDGTTDLSNGVLLCTGCHHRVHRDGWEITIRDGTVWFTPPAHVDPQRRPRAGGRRRFELAA